MKVLVACEFSGIVREAFRKKGHDAWSCDLLPTEIPGQHIHGDVMDSFFITDWDLVIAHPPCTYLSNSGVRWLYNKDGSHNHERWERMRVASYFFMGFIDLARLHNIRVCIENPIPHKHAKRMIGYNYNQIIQPYQFGHTTSKATCLWLFGLPKLKSTNVIQKQDRTFDIHRMAPGPNRQKDRSRTFQGIANAMAEQWG